jgi:hypothetical protein
MKDETMSKKVIKINTQKLQYSFYRKNKSTNFIY